MWTVDGCSETGASQDYLVGFHQLTILTGQGNMRDLLVVSKGRAAFPKLWHFVSYNRSSLRGPQVTTFPAGLTQYLNNPILWLRFCIHIGTKSIQGSRGAVEKPTALDGYPTGQLFWGKKTWRNWTWNFQTSQGKLPVKKTGLKRISRGLKQNHKRRTHLKSTSTYLWILLWNCCCHSQCW